ncbi:MAG: single-stranded-DNA-specific exonuclease RecJ [Peptococcaceae bacterium]|nr:single-stranded-DNA-specific exonuclease RecJ [Peptococcaceae bacterium]
MNIKKKWRIKFADPILTYILKNELKISLVLAKLLVNRGIVTAREAKGFLEAGPDEMHNPFLMADMDRAVARLKLALDKQQKILIYGDYDADGITASALLVKAIGRLGGLVNYYIPDRIEEGYGLHLGALTKAGEQGCELVVTVDCGISALETVRLNRLNNGPDIIITDHHEPLEVLPEAISVLNPKRKDCNYPFKTLAGVGVALKLVQALYSVSDQEDSDGWKDFFDLACLGTVADIVPLNGENRIIVKYGLEAIANTDRVGICELMRVSGVKPEQLDTRKLGFALVPRINAAGRVGDPSQAVRLLLTEDGNEAVELALLLHRNNQERQRIESLVLADAMGILDAEPGLSEGQAIVLASEKWHSGVVGIVSSRLVDRYFKPVLLIALEENEGKGSGRSIPGIHLYQAISHCGEYLSRFGGHAQAVGFSISPDKIESFRNALNNYLIETTDSAAFIPGINFDAEVSLDEVDDLLVQEISKLEPFGHCNPDPVLACSNISVLSCREIGKNGGHLKMVIGEKGLTMDGVGFKMADCLDEISSASLVDLAFIPSINQWQGRSSIQLEIKLIRESSEGFEIWSEECESIDYADSIPSFDRAEESLRVLGPLAFEPEWLIPVLHQYGKHSGFIYPGGHLEHYTDQALNLTKEKTSCTESISSMNIPNKRSIIEALLSGNEGGTIVLVSSSARAVETAIYLNHSGISAAFLHSGLGCEDRSSVIEWFSVGKRVLVSTYNLSMDKEINPNKIILLDPPYNSNVLKWFNSKDRELLSIFGSKEIEDSLAVLEAAAPSRDVLGELYNIIRSQKSGAVTPELALELLYQRGLRQAGIHTLAYGLAVFSELKFFNWSLKGNEYFIEYNSIEGKRDLNDSQIFRSGQKIAKAMKSWWT